VSRAPIGSIGYRETVLLGDSYFREQGFYSNTFTWHFPMDPNACLCYPSQPGVTQTFPKVSLTMDVFSANEGVIAVPQGILTADFGSGPRFTGDTQWSSGEGACSQAVAASTSGYPLGGGGTLTAWSRCQGGEQGFGFWPEFICPVVTSPLLLSTLSP
jgi:hypothetical protein